jgi:serine-type D-Ala-D-Ala carboxypeptidase/endopeptidase (penicillin-binding protein 4)
MRHALAALLATVLVSGCQHTHVRPSVPAHPALPALTALPALQHDIDAIVAAPALEHGYWGVLVKSLDTNDTLYSVNARKLMMPASDMKIVTLAAAAARLGWGFQYRTTLMTAGAIANSTLDGDLVVVGSGDPSITDATAPTVFTSWADGLKAQGITTIAGRIVGDDGALGDEPLGMGWSWDDLADGYAAGVGALQFDENMARVTIAPGPEPGTPALATITPAAAGLVVRNRITTGAAGSAESLEMRRQSGSAELELRGSIARGSPPRVHTVSVDKPGQFFVAALRDALKDAGIDVRGEAVSIADADHETSLGGMRLLLESRSPPLSTLAIRMMKASQNQYAETLLLTLGAAAGAPTAANGAATAALILEPWGVRKDALIQRDGSGLSRYDYVTPETLVTILTHVDSDATLRTPFEASLPIAGRDGTLANRLHGTAAEGNVRAKSGSMSNVRALSGYATSADGERLVFSIIANNFETSADVVNAATDAIVVRLAQFTRRARTP